MRGQGQVSVVLIGLCLAAAARAGSFDWATIGDPGNRPTRPDEMEFFTDRELGAVDYIYRISRTEVTVAQWAEYVEAYLPYYEGSLIDVRFMGNQLFAFGGEVSIVGNPQNPATMSWEHAARYINWLHNDKAAEQWVFESGVYDTSTFTQDPDTNLFNHEMEPSAGARYWIPREDEWVKATYWDPSLNGGEGGYWLHSGGSADPLLPGPPGVGETNEATGQLTPVGSYPDTVSPWGLLDTSGGVSEWTTTNPYQAVDASAAVILGSSYFAPSYFDHLGVRQVSTPTGAGFGLRIATIPGPASSLVFFVCVAPLKPLRSSF